MATPVWPLTTLSDYGLVRSPEFKNIIHPCGVNPTTGARIEQRLSKQSHETLTWKIVLKSRLTSEAATLYTFFCDRRGDYEAFNITDPVEQHRLPGPFHRRHDGLRVFLHPAVQLAAEGHPGG